MKSCLFPLCMISCALFCEEMWSSPKAVNENIPLTQFAFPGITLNDSGVAIVNWANYETDMAARFLYSSYSKNFGTTWSMPYRFNSPYILGGSGNRFLVSPITPSGNSVLAWDEQMDLSSDATSLKASYFTQSEGWQTSIELNSPGSFPNEFIGYPFSFSIGANNRACVVWNEKNSTMTSSSVKAAFYESGWQPSTILESSSLSFTGPFLSMSTSGEKAIICWKVQTLMGSQLASRASNGTSWGPKSIISSTSPISNSISKPAIAINDDGTAVACWIEEQTMPPSSWTLYVSIYNPTLNTWSTGHPLSSSSTRQFLTDPFLVINQLGHAAITWIEVDQMMSQRYFYASFYDGTSWDTKTQIHLDGDTERTSISVALNDSDLSVAAFLATNGSPTAPLYISSRKPSSMWTSAIEVSPDVLGLPLPYVFISLHNELAFVPFANQDSPTEISIKEVVFSDGETSNFSINTISPSFSTLINPPWVSRSPNGVGAAAWGQVGSDLLLTSFTSSLSPPTDGVGFQTESKFLVSTDVINVLSWTASTTANVRYNVYRNGTYIATTYGPSYDDHQRVLGEASLYSVTSLNEAGAESAPLLILVGASKS